MTQQYARPYNESIALGQTDSQVDASQHKFAKPELAYELMIGGETDSQDVSRVHTSCKKS